MERLIESSVHCLRRTERWSANFLALLENKMDLFALEWNHSAIGMIQRRMSDKTGDIARRDIARVRLQLLGTSSWFLKQIQGGFNWTSLTQWRA